MFLNGWCVCTWRQEFWSIHQHTATAPSTCKTPVFPTYCMSVLRRCRDAARSPTRTFPFIGTLRPHCPGASKTVLTEEAFSSLLVTLNGIVGGRALTSARRPTRRVAGTCPRGMALACLRFTAALHQRGAPRGWGTTSACPCESHSRQPPRWHACRRPADYNHGS